MLSIAILLHLLSAVVWVGGMFFAYMVLRPVAGGVLEPPLRLELWRQIFSRFFPWVSLSIVILFITGLWMSWAMLGVGVATLVLNASYALFVVEHAGMRFLRACHRQCLFFSLRACCD